MEQNNSLIHQKSFDYAVRIVRLTQHLQKHFHDYVLSQQIMKSGISIGANVRESRNAQSRADFINQLNIALKEADKTGFWLELLYATDYLTKDEFESIYNDNKFIITILTKIIKSTKESED